MFTKEEIKNSIQNIVNLSNEDPEEIYVTKWTIENKLKEKDPSYTKKTLAKFISDLHLGRFIFVHNGSSLPFSIYEGYVFVASESSDFSYFIKTIISYFSVLCSYFLVLIIFPLSFNLVSYF